MALIETIRYDIAAGQLCLDAKNRILYAVNECGERRGEIGGGGYLLMYCPYNVKHKVAARMEQVGGQLTDWNFELRGAQAWIADENRWDYSSVKVHLPNGDYHFAL